MLSQHPLLNRRKPRIGRDPAGRQGSGPQALVLGRGQDRTPGLLPSTPGPNIGHRVYSSVPQDPYKVSALCLSAGTVMLCWNTAPLQAAFNRIFFFFPVLKTEILTVQAGPRGQGLVL